MRPNDGTDGARDRSPTATLSETLLVNAGASAAIVAVGLAILYPVVATTVLAAGVAAWIAASRAAGFDRSANRRRICLPWVGVCVDV